MPWNIDMSWQDRASCQGIDTELFFTPEKAPPGTQIPELETIRRMCAMCEVRDKCFEHAIKHELHGAWAGTTPRERADYRRERGIWVDRPELDLTS